MIMQKLKRVVIKEEYISITGDVLEAIILNQMIYWSERISDFDKYIEEENARQRKFARPSQGDEILEIPLMYGWIYKGASDIKEEIMSTDSEKTINRRLANLVEKGFLDRRNNPKVKYDRTYQYRVNFSTVIKRLAEHGYTLQDYKVDLSSIQESLNTDKGQIDAYIRQIDELKEQIGVLKSQYDALKSQGDVCNSHHVAAIPETISETISEITTEESNSKGNIIPYLDIINYLNKVAKTNYKHSASKTKSLIDARFKEGFKLEDFKVVIDKKVREWIGTEMEKYIRPETLFGTKFESYLNQKQTSYKGKNSNWNMEGTRNYISVNNLDALENKLLGWDSHGAASNE